MTKQRATRPNPVSKQPTPPVKKTLKSDGAVESTDRATGVTTVEAPPAEKPKNPLRGHSTVDGPVNLTWVIADRMFAAARAAGEPKPKRKDVQAAAMAEGVAYYTARTQYQAWFAHTDRGTKLMADGNLPTKKRAAKAAAEDEGGEE